MVTIEAHKLAVSILVHQFTTTTAAGVGVYAARLIMKNTAEAIRNLSDGVTRALPHGGVERLSQSSTDGRRVTRNNGHVIYYPTAVLNVAWTIIQLAQTISFR